MDYTTLVAEVKNLKNALDIERNALQAKMQTIISNVMADANIDSIATFKMRGTESAEIAIPRPDKNYSYTIDLYFRLPWEWDGKNAKRKVELNVGTLGSFAVDYQPIVNYYVVAGALASKLKTLQEKFDALDDSAYTKALNAFNTAHYGLEKIERERKEQEHFQNIKEIESKLVVGTKLRIGYNWKKEPIYDTIAHVTSKNVLLEKDYGTRTKKTVAIDRILCKKWEFA